MDRLAELFAARGGGRTSASTPSAGGGPYGGVDGQSNAMSPEDIEMGMMAVRRQEAATAEEEKKMEKFYKIVNQLKAIIPELETQIVQSEELHANVLREVGQQKKQAQHILDKTKAHIQKLMEQAKTLLGALKDDNKAFLKQLPSAEKREIEKTGLKNPLQRIRENYLDTWSRKFLQVAAAFQETQNRFRTKTTEAFAHEFKILNPAASDEDVQRALHSGARPEQMFQDQMLARNTAAAQQTLLEVSERYTDALELEKDIAAVQRLFLDFSILVSQQGEIINQIEYNVSQSKNHMNTGMDQVLKAEEHQKGSMKTKWCILIVVISIMVVLGLSLGLGVGLKSK
eukprot:gnl/Spiro4/21993_TR10802_c0_g1_i1.p1 gnl/Spiro4/21993_TR10802_c0_g1~~gnl/Spiro4/21993_TR10802_c0_g1_i1.p1  ORF type:complete len:353 (+),score=78.69 gnl/Spiro4/21993_TR10802_c0_g1_i1:32-1060(+)